MRVEIALKARILLDPELLHYATIIFSSSDPNSCIFIPVFRKNRARI